jgi:hypothetical protein
VITIALVGVSGTFTPASRTLKKRGLLLLIDAQYADAELPLFRRRGSASAATRRRGSRDPLSKRCFGLGTDLLLMGITLHRVSGGKLGTGEVERPLRTECNDSIVAGAYAAAPESTAECDIG